MEQILAFLIKNIYFVIVVVGLIYTMFFRKSPIERPPENRPGNRPAQRPNQRMPDFGGSPVFPPKPQRPSAPTMSTPQAPGPLPVERREPRPEYAGRPPEPAPRPAEPVLRVPATVAQVEEPSYRVTEPAASLAAIPERPLPSAPVLASRSSAEEGGALTRDDLTRAIVWAEILGPPRARRPYRG